MATNIFNISAYAAGTTYLLNQIVSYNGYFWYSLSNGNVGNTPTINSLYWGGVATNQNTGLLTPEFIWTPAYPTKVDIRFSNKYIKFGDGYEQRAADGINNALLNLEVNFSNRNINEAAAIIHFIYARQGRDSFLFTPHAPFQVKKLFVCKQLPTDFTFYDNMSIPLTFEETVA